MADARRPDRGCSLGEAVAFYAADRHARGELTDTSARDISSRFARLIKMCPPGMAVAELDVERIKAWQREIGSFRPTTRRAYLSALRVFCRWAVDEGLLDADPTARLAKVKEPRTVPRALSGPQMDRLRAVVSGDDRAKLIIELMAVLGLRCTEVAALTIADVDPWARTIRVVGKGSHERLLPVPADIVGLLDVVIGARTAGPVMGGYTSARISLLVSAWMDASGMKTDRYDGISAHALRHTAASNLLDRCHDVRMVQALLGHSNISTTDRYLRVTNLDNLRQALEGDREPTPPDDHGVIVPLRRRSRP
jgi:site-specific recombinase XerD